MESATQNEGPSQRIEKDRQPQNHGTTSYLYDSILSPFYDRLTEHLWPHWLHPNYITLLGAAFCAGSIVAFGENAKKMSCVGWTLYHMCDNMDGKQARRTNKTSRFGGFLDHSVDGLLGVYMGYIAVITIVFGVESGSELFHTARHSFFLLWLTPHILSQLNPSQGLILGTKVCSVDEGFLGVSLLLYYHGWVNDKPIIPDHPRTVQFLCQGMATIALGAVSHGLLTSKHHRRLFWVGLFFSFAAVGFELRSSELLWWTLWVPIMLASVFH